MELEMMDAIVIGTVIGIVYSLSGQIMLETLTALLLQGKRIEWPWPFWTMSVCWPVVCYVIIVKYISGRRGSPRQ